MRIDCRRDSSSVQHVASIRLHMVEIDFGKLVDDKCCIRNLIAGFSADIGLAEFRCVLVFIFVNLSDRPQGKGYLLPIIVFRL